MDLNTIFVSLFGILLFYAGYTAWTTPTPVTLNPVRSGLLVAQDTGKSKQIQSKTGDASLVIERLRRRAIQGHGRVHKSRIKETRTQMGSTTGAIETYIFSSICPCPPKCDPYDVIYDGGGENSEYCEIVGDGYLDAGNATTKACGI
jgi:hypothetical protein